MNKMAETIEGRKALVTGASRGIGKAIALELGKQGAYVLGTATTATGAEQISAYLKAAGVRGQGLVLNVADNASLDNLLTWLKDNDTYPEILINNAAITRDNLLLRMKDSEWDEVIQTNLTGLFRLTKACIKSMMKAHYGRIVNISSIVGVIGNAGQANYAAAKAGVIGFTKSVAKEIASRNVTVNAIAPGFIATDMTDAIPEKEREALKQQIPAHRLGEVADIADAVSYLVGASYVTGQTLHVNGGMHMA